MARTHEQRVRAVNPFAEREGWAIFNGVDLQRDDEASMFPSDEAALAHVQRLARHGSAFHQEALRLVGLPPDGTHALLASTAILDAVEAVEHASRDAGRWGELETAEARVSAARARLVSLIAER